VSESITAERGRSTVDPARERELALVAAAVLAVALVPLAVSSALPRAWLAVVGALALASLAPRAPVRLAGMAVAISAAYLGAFASLPSLVVLAAGGALALAAALLPRAGRSTLLLGIASVVVVLVIGWRVLRGAAWQPEADALGPMGAGAAFAAAALGAVLTLHQRGSTRLGLAPGLLVAAACLVAGARSVASPAPARIPGWHVTLERLSAARAAGRDDDVIAALDALATAGARDAALARVAAGVRANAGPELLRRLCPRRGRRLLDATWQADVDLGERTCAAVRGLPDEGARRLGESDDPALRRLQGDLLLQAGLWREAGAAYTRARDAGDPYAERDLVLGLAGLGHLDHARALATGTDPTLDPWLGVDPATPEDWAAWNRLLDLSTLEPPERRGLRVTDAPGDLPTVVDREVGRRVVCARARADLDFAATLPPTPARAVPRRLHLWMKTDGKLRVEVTGAGQPLAWGCADEVRRLPDVVCAGGWADVTLDLDDVRPPLGDVVVRGRFRLARVAAEP